MSDRKKRVQRLKMMILGFVALLLILPSLFCILFVVKVGKLEQQIQVLQEEVKIQATAKQEDQITVRKEIIENLTPKEEVGEDNLSEENFRKVYLTFDDGPSQYTEDILEILDFYNVKATFFVTGMNISQYGGYYNRIVEEGHSLGIHSYSHIYSDIYSSLDSFRNDWRKMQDYLYQCTGKKVTLYRFPGGSSNSVASKTTMKEITKWLEEEGVVYYDWNVSAQDATSAGISAKQIVTNCVEGVKRCNTAIVLLHDGAGKKSTIEALPLIIEGIQELENTVLLPITEETMPIQHISSAKE